HSVAAFGLSAYANIAMMPKNQAGEPLPEILDKHIASEIDLKIEQWRGSMPYPDLMRRRDRHAFRRVARHTGTVIIVCAADPFTGQYIGKTRYRPFPFHLLGIPRSSPPNQGLITADPDEPGLGRLLKGLCVTGGYDDYKVKLEQLGLMVSGREEGYLVRNELGTAFYPGYYLHGVYK